MRFSSCLVVLVGAAASVSARPVPDAHVNDVFPRELQYSDIVELEGGAPEYGKPRSDKAHHGGNYASGYNFWDRDHHERPHHARHPQPHPHPEEHGHGSAHGDVMDNIVKFLSHEARSVVDFLSHETRAEHEHEHEHRHHERENEDDARGLPQAKVLDHIVDFLASTVKR